MGRAIGGAAMVTLLAVRFVLPMAAGAGPARLLSRGAAPRVAAQRAVPPAKAKACSFSASTKVVLADGTTTPIATIEPGDQVLAADPETGERGARTVTHVWAHKDMLVDLKTSDGAVVATTQDHPFWNATDQRWQPAIALDPGDRLLTADGTLLMVDGLDLTTADSGVAYNLTVADLHTYYVGIGDHTALVHNRCFYDAKTPTTRYFREQLGKRGIKPKDALHTYNHGDTYVDPNRNTVIRYDPKKKIAVTAVSGEGIANNVFRGPVDPNWVRVKKVDGMPLVPKKKGR